MYIYIYGYTFIYLPSPPSTHTHTTMTTRLTRAGQPPGVDWEDAYHSLDGRLRQLQAQYNAKEKELGLLKVSIRKGKGMEALESATSGKSNTVLSDDGRGGRGGGSRRGVENNVPHGRRGSRRGARSTGGIRNTTNNTSSSTFSAPPPQGPLASSDPTRANGGNSVGREGMVSSRSPPSHSKGQSSAPSTEWEEGKKSRDLRDPRGRPGMFSLTSSSSRSSSHSSYSSSSTSPPPPGWNDYHREKEYWCTSSRGKGWRETERKVGSGSFGRGGGGQEEEGSSFFSSTYLPPHRYPPHYTETTNNSHPSNMGRNEERHRPTSTTSSSSSSAAAVAAAAALLPDPSMIWGDVLEAELSKGAPDCFFKLQRASQALFHANEALRRELEESSSKVRRLEQELGASRGGFIQKESAVTALQEEVYRLVRERDLAAMDRRTAELEVEGLQGVIADRTAELSSLRTRLTAGADHNEGLRQELRQAGDLLEARTAENATLRSKLACTESSLTSQRHTNEQLLVEVQSLQEQVLVERKKVLQLAREVQQNALMQPGQEMLQEQIRELQDKNVRLEGQHLSLMKEFVDVSERAMREAREALQEDLRAEKATAAHWEEAAKRLYQDITARRGEHHTVQMERDEARAEREALRRELREVKRQLSLCLSKLDVAWPQHHRVTEHLPPSELERLMKATAAHQQLMQETVGRGGSSRSGSGALRAAAVEKTEKQEEEESTQEHLKRIEQGLASKNWRGLMEYLTKRQEGRQKQCTDEKPSAQEEEENPLGLPTSSSEGRKAKREQKDREGNDEKKEGLGGESEKEKIRTLLGKGIMDTTLDNYLQLLPYDPTTEAEKFWEISEAYAAVRAELDQMRLSHDILQSNLAHLRGEKGKEVALRRAAEEREAVGHAILAEELDRVHFLEQQIDSLRGFEVEPHARLVIKSPEGVGEEDRVVEVEGRMEGREGEGEGYVSTVVGARRLGSDGRQSSISRGVGRGELVVGPGENVFQLFLGQLVSSFVAPPVYSAMGSTSGTSPPPGPSSSSSTWLTDTFFCTADFLLHETIVSPTSTMGLHGFLDTTAAYCIRMDALLLYYLSTRDLVVQLHRVRREGEEITSSPSSSSFPVGGAGSGEEEERGGIRSESEEERERKKKKEEMEGEGEEKQQPESVVENGGKETPAAKVVQNPLSTITPHSGSSAGTTEIESAGVTGGGTGDRRSGSGSTSSSSLKFLDRMYETVAEGRVRLLDWVFQESLLHSSSPTLRGHLHLYPFSRPEKKRKDEEEKMKTRRQGEPMEARDKGEGKGFPPLSTCSMPSACSSSFSSSSSPALTPLASLEFRVAARLPFSASFKQLVREAMETITSTKEEEEKEGVGDDDAGRNENKERMTKGRKYRDEEEKNPFSSGRARISPSLSSCYSSCSEYFCVGKTSFRSPGKQWTGKKVCQTRGGAVVVSASTGFVRDGVEHGGGGENSDLPASQTSSPPALRGGGRRAHHTSEEGGGDSGPGGRDVKNKDAALQWEGNRSLVDPPPPYSSTSPPPPPLPSPPSHAGAAPERLEMGGSNNSRAERQNRELYPILFSPPYPSSVSQLAVLAHQGRQQLEQEQNRHVDRSGAEGGGPGSTIGTTGGGGWNQVNNTNNVTIDRHHHHPLFGAHRRRGERGHGKSQKSMATKAGISSMTHAPGLESHSPFSSSSSSLGSSYTTSGTSYSSSMYYSSSYYTQSGDEPPISSSSPSRHPYHYRSLPAPLISAVGGDENGGEGRTRRGVRMGSPSPASDPPSRVTESYANVCGVSPLPVFGSGIYPPPLRYPSPPRPRPNCPSPPPAAPPVSMTPPSPSCTSLIPPASSSVGGGSKVGQTEEDEGRRNLRSPPSSPLGPPLLSLSPGLPGPTSTVSPTGSPSLPTLPPTVQTPFSPSDALPSSSSVGMVGSTKRRGEEEEDSGGGDGCVCVPALLSGDGVPGSPFMAQQVHPSGVFQYLSIDIIAVELSPSVPSPIPRLGCFYELRALGREVRLPPPPTPRYTIVYPQGEEWKRRKEMEEKERGREGRRERLNEREEEGGGRTIFPIRDLPEKMSLRREALTLFFLDAGYPSPSVSLSPPSSPLGKGRGGGKQKEVEEGPAEVVWGMAMCELHMVLDRPGIPFEFELPLLGPPNGPVTLLSADRGGGGAAGVVKVRLETFVPSSAALSWMEEERRRGRGMENTATLASLPYGGGASLSAMRRKEEGIGMVQGVSSSSPPLHREWQRGKVWRREGDEKEKKEDSTLSLGIYDQHPRRPSPSYHGEEHKQHSPSPSVTATRRAGRTNLASASYSLPPPPPPRQFFSLSSPSTHPSAPSASTSSSTTVTTSGKTTHFTFPTWTETSLESTPWGGEDGGGGSQEKHGKKKEEEKSAFFGPPPALLSLPLTARHPSSTPPSLPSSSPEFSLPPGKSLEIGMATPPPRTPSTSEVTPPYPLFFFSGNASAVSPPPPVGPGSSVPPPPELGTTPSSAETGEQANMNRRALSPTMGGGTTSTTSTTPTPPPLSPPPYTSTSPVSTPPPPPVSTSANAIRHAVKTVEEQQEMLVNSKTIPPPPEPPSTLRVSMEEQLLLMEMERAWRR